MTNKEFLEQSTGKLKKAGIATARLDCLVLMEDIIGSDRTSILAHPEDEVPKTKLTLLNKKVIQRSKHVPLAYIRGKAPFFGREFMINKHVLTPRPESETMIEMLKGLPLPPSPRIADIGSGSGCLGVTAVLEIPGSAATFYDIDSEALKVTNLNLKFHKINGKCVKSDLLEKLSPADVLLANLPYVPERFAINKAAQHEPKHAIFSGKDGLNLYRRFWAQIAALEEQKPIFVLTESLPPQHNELAGIARSASYELYESQDFIQVFVPSARRS